MQSIDEATTRAATTGMVAQRGQRLDESLAEPRYIDRRDILELTKADIASDDRRQSPVVRSAERADSTDA